MDTPTPTGIVREVAVLDLSTLSGPDDLAGIHEIRDVAVVLIPASLAGALTRIPMSNVAGIVPVPDGAEVRVHTGGVVMSGEALAAPDADGAVLVVTGSLIVSSPVERVAFRQLIVTGVVLAPHGSEAALGAGLTRVTGSVQYYRPAEGQQVRTLSGQNRIGGAFLANAGGNPDDVLFMAGQTIVTDLVDTVGFQRVVAAGQILLPRESQGVLAPVLTTEGQLVWYGGRNPRVFLGSDTFGRDLFELLDVDTDLVLVGDFALADDVTGDLLQRIGEITLLGTLHAPHPLRGLLQLKITCLYGELVTGAPGDRP